VTDGTDPRRRSFGPVVLVGLASAGLVALAGHKAWVVFGRSGVVSDGGGLGRPEVEALGLVALAAWGVLLVTRGRVRRAIAVLAALAGIVATALAVHGLVDFRSVEVAVGYFSYDDAPLTMHRSAWGWVAVVAGALTTLAALAAFRLAPGWPEMGRKYDAPAGGPTPALPLEEQSSLDVWKAFDAGHDPTAGPPPDRSE
jgi:uncharacterized membrane protein (TIGR02234 family)